MTIHIFQGLGLVSDSSQPGDPTIDLQNVELTLVVPDGTTDFSYTISAPAGAGEFPEVATEINDRLMAINGVSLDTLAELMSGGMGSFDTYIGQVTHSGGQVTQILSLELSPDGIFGIQFLFELGGAPLPALNSLADLDALEDSITAVGAIPAGTALSAGANIPFSSLPNHSSRDDNFVEGTAGDDVLSGTAGDDVIFPRGTVDYDQINGSSGNDIFDFSESQEGDFYEVHYENLSGPITVDIDVETGFATVEKTGQGVDTWIDAFRAMDGNTGDGMFVTGTSGDDVFNLALEEYSWLGIAAGGGNDTYNIYSGETGGEIVRIKFNTDGNSDATSGVNVDLSSGVVSNDGFGGSDQINVMPALVDIGGMNIERSARVEIRATDHNDMIIGSGRDERFILEQGNDTLEAGDGWDLLRYDRSGVDAVTVDLGEGLATGTWDGNSFTHHISGVEAVRGANYSNDTLIGDENENALYGRGGDDTLTGGGGYDSVPDADWLDGGDGDDVLLGDDFYAAYDAETSGKVFRLYQATLGRAPDSGGHQDWMERLITEEITLAEAASGFVGSQEFQNTYGSLDDTAFVELLYQNVLGRGADAGGLATWTGQLAGGASRASVVTGFSQSQEFINNTAVSAARFTEAQTPASWFDEVYRVYQATLGRAPDANGFLNWVERLGSGSELADVVAGFVGSQEFQNTYGSLDDNAFVELLYQNVLGRASDTGGLATWTGLLAGGSSREEVVLGFSESQEFINNTNTDLTEWVRWDMGWCDDYLKGEEGNNVLAGGMFADTFIFETTYGGNHTVLDLEAWDILAFEDFNYTTSDEVRANMVQDGADVVFSDQGVNVTLLETQLADISDMMISLW